MPFQVIEMLQRYDSGGSGRLNLQDFARLIREMEAFEVAETAREAKSADSASSAETTAEGQPASRRTRDGSAAADALAEEAVSVPEMPAERGEHEAPYEPPPISSAGAPVDPPPMRSAQRASSRGARADSASRPPPKPSRYVAARPMGGRPAGRPTVPRRLDVDEATGGAVSQVFGGGGAFGGSGGGVFGFDDFVGQLELGGDEAGVLGLLAEHAGGKTLHHSQQWVVRAMRALELRYQASAREEAAQRFNLEVHAHELAHELSVHKEALSHSEVAARSIKLDPHPRPSPSAHTEEKWHSLFTQLQP